MANPPAATISTAKAIKAVRRIACANDGAMRTGCSSGALLTRAAAHGCDLPAEAQPKEELAEVERSLVPEEGIEPTRVDPTGF